MSSNWNLAHNQTEGEVAGGKGRVGGNKSLRLGLAQCDMRLKQMSKWLQWRSQRQRQHNTVATCVLAAAAAATSPLVAAVAVAAVATALPCPTNMIRAAAAAWRPSFAS